MKLIVAVVQDYDVDHCLRAVAAAGLRATRLASAGGFLRTGNTTLLLGVPDDAVRRCLTLLGGSGGARTETFPDPVGAEFLEFYDAGVAKVTLGGGVAFVVNVVRFERIG